MLNKTQKKAMARFKERFANVSCDGIVNCEFATLPIDTLTIDDVDSLDAGTVSFFDNGLIVKPGGKYATSGLKTGLPYMPTSGHDKYILSAANLADRPNGVYATELRKNDGKKRKILEWLDLFDPNLESPAQISGEIVYAGSKGARQGLIISINGERYSTKLRNLSLSNWVMIPSCIAIGNPYHTFFSRIMAGQPITLGLYVTSPSTASNYLGRIGEYDYAVCMPDVGVAPGTNDRTTMLVGRFKSSGSNVSGRRFYMYSCTAGIETGDTSSKEIEQMGLDALILSYLFRSVSKFNKESIISTLFKRIDTLLRETVDDTAITFATFIEKLFHICNARDHGVSEEEANAIIEAHTHYFGGPQVGTVYEERALPGGGSLPGVFWLYGTKIDDNRTFRYNVEEIHAFISGELVSFKGNKAVDFVNAIYARNIVCTEEFLKTTEQYKAVAAQRAKRCKATLLSDVPLQHPDTLAKLLNYSTPGILCYELGDTFDDKEFRYERPLDLANLRPYVGSTYNDQANTLDLFYERINGSGEVPEGDAPVKLGTVAHESGTALDIAVANFRDRIRELYFTDVARGMARDETLERALGAHATGEEVADMLNTSIRIDDTPDSIVLSHQAHRYMRGRSLRNMTPGCVAMGAMNAKKSKGLASAILSTLINVQKVSK